jgi:hypothetical protein
MDYIVSSDNIPENRRFLKPDDPLPFRPIRLTPVLTKTSWVQCRYVDWKTVQGPDGQTGRGDDLVPIRSEERSPEQSDLPTVGEVRSPVEGDFRSQLVDGRWT